MGVSHLLEHMVFKGTERRSAKEIALVARDARRLARRVHVARAHVVSGARARRAPRDAADVIGGLRVPPAAASERSALERKVILEEIGMVEDTPDDLVFELHNERLWGDNRYGYSDPRHARHRRVDSPRAICASCTAPPIIRPTSSWRPLATSSTTELVDILNETGWGDSYSDRMEAPSRLLRRSHPGRRTRTSTGDGAQTHIVVGAPAWRTAIRAGTPSASSACCSAAA